MATNRTTQEYLNAKAGTVGLTKQQALARLTGLSETQPIDILWNAYAATSAIAGRTAQEAANFKTGGNPVTTYTKQEAASRL
jgi:hypothetical protein